MLLALFAPTSFWLDVHFKIFSVVVVVEFLAGSDVLLGEYIDPSVAYINLAVGETGVVDVAGLVSGDIAVDHRVLTCPKKIFAAVFVLFFL